MRLSAKSFKNTAMLKYDSLLAVDKQTGCWCFVGSVFTSLKLWERAVRRSLSMLNHFKLGLGPAGTGPEKESALYLRKLGTNWTCEADNQDCVATLT